MTSSTRSGLPPSTSKSSSLRSKQASDVLNVTATFNASLSNFITLIIFFWEEITLLQAHDEDFQGTLSDDNHQKNINDHIKLIGGFSAVGFSIVASIAWLIYWRRRSADPTFDIAAELDKQKDRPNPWARRYLTGSVPGNMLGQAVGDIAAHFLPRPFAKVLKAAASALLGVITGIAAMVILGDGEDLRSEKSLSAKFLDGKDGWTRSFKIYVPLGGAIGTAIGASLGLLIFGPAGVIIGAILGGTLGWIAGIGTYLLRNRFAKPKTVVVMGHDDIVTDNRITQNLPKVLTNEHANKLYILRVADRVDKKTNEPYKILLYRSLTPSGRTKTALLKIGLSHNCDIKHDLTTSFDLYALDNKVKKEILKITSKRGHIPPICAADSKDRTKQRRVGLGLGLALGGMIGVGAGYGLSFVFPMLAVALPGTVGVLMLGPFLFSAIAVPLLMVAGYYFMKHLGPKISAWINPDDYIENSYEYCIATGQVVTKGMASGVPGLVHKFSNISNDVDDVITNASSIIGAGIGVACGIYEGRKQNARLLNKLSKNTLPAGDPDKELVDAEIEHKFAAKFNANKKITTTTQSMVEFAKYSGLVFVLIGFLIGNAIFPGIGGLMGGAIGGFVGGGGASFVAYKWGDQIYAGLIKGANWLVNRVHRLLTKKVPVETVSAPTANQTSYELSLLVERPIEEHNVEDTDSSFENTSFNAAAEDRPPDAAVAKPAPVSTAGLVAPPLPATAAESVLSFIIYEPASSSVSPVVPAKSPRVVSQQFSPNSDDIIKPGSSSSPRSTSPKIGRYQPYDVGVMPVQMNQGCEPGRVSPFDTHNKSPVEQAGVSSFKNQSELATDGRGLSLSTPPPVPNIAQRLKFSTPGPLPKSVVENKATYSSPLPRKPMPVSSPINIVGSKNKHRVKLGQSYFLSDQIEPSPESVNTGQGLLEEKELSKRTQIPQLAKHTVRGEEEQAKNILAEHPEYALEILKESIRDRSGCEYKDYSPLQLAYLVGDVAMCQMILSVFLRSKEKDYQKYHEALRQIEDIQKKLKSNNLTYDFEGLANTIQNDKEIFKLNEDEEFSLNDLTRNALNEFKATFAANEILPHQRLAIVKLLGDASRIYAKHYSQWSAAQSSLYWSHVIGGLQRLLPASYLQAVYEGLKHVIGWNFYPIPRHATAIPEGLGTDYAILSALPNFAGAFVDNYKARWLVGKNANDLSPGPRAVETFIKNDLLLIEQFHHHNEAQLQQFVSQLESVVRLRIATPSLDKTNLPKIRSQGSLSTDQEGKKHLYKKSHDDASFEYNKKEMLQTEGKENANLSSNIKEDSYLQSNQYKRRMSHHFFNFNGSKQRVFNQRENLGAQADTRVPTSPVR